MMTPFEENGWKIIFHPLFREIFNALILEVDKLKKKDFLSYESHPKAKLLKRIAALILEEIPRDPASSLYDLGNTLGKDYKHWKRAKFLDRFRVFFRYSSSQKLLVYVWINDKNSLRKEGVKNGPYALFQKRLKSGYPPDDLQSLCRDCVGNTRQK